MEWYTFPNLRRLDISRFAVGRRFSLPPSLVELRFRQCIINEDCDLVRLDAPNLVLPELRYLILSDTPVELWTVRKFIGATPRLDILHIDDCLDTVFYRKTHWLNFGSYRNLVELDISGTECVTDAYVRRLVIGLTRLKILDLSFTRISPKTMKMLADHRGMCDNYPSLDRLHVRGCRHVSFYWCEYAQSKGIEVSQESEH